MSTDIPASYDAGSGPVVVAADGGTDAADGGDAGQNVCTVPTTRANNEQGVGGYCEAGKGQCPPPSFCTADYTPSVKQGFCSLVCDPSMQGQCGSSSFCYQVTSSTLICIPSCCASTCASDGGAADGG